ncbi:MAG: AAA family ATPase [Anaerolineales bacterium]
MKKQGETVEVSLVRTLAEAVIGEVERAVVGKTEVLTHLLACFLAGGHVLLEDYPGLGKTLIAKSLANALGLEFRRIQFTPDLLPADITGSYFFSRSSDSFELRRGPIFTNILLGDEINRASPRTQSALLESMQEYQVTLEGESIRLPDPFLVIATQNPIEYEGTFPLPEAQLDRFMMRLQVGYPSLEQEQEILSRRRSRQTEELPISRVVQIEQLAAARAAVETIHVDPDIERYIVQLASATRRDPRVAVGASPRGALALMKASRAWAAIHGRDFVLPDDVKRLAKPALIHRLLLLPEFWLKRSAPEDVIEASLAAVPVPVLEGI